ncbi:MAG: hypothetical protein ACK44Z_17320, partial [Pirellulaceae bacterium]
MTIRGSGGNGREALGLAGGLPVGGGYRPARWPSLQRIQDSDAREVSPDALTAKLLKFPPASILGIKSPMRHARFSWNPQGVRGQGNSLLDPVEG